MTGESVEGGQMATTMSKCDRCGVEGERGDQPGEGKIVQCGGEAAMRPYANGSLCDECADALMEGLTCAHCGKTFVLTDEERAQDQAGTLLDEDGDYHCATCWPKVWGDRS